MPELFPNFPQVYPQLPLARARAIARDLLLVVGLLACLWLGRAVHGAVLQLDALGKGVQDVGHDVNGAFNQVGDKVHKTPIVGKKLDNALEDAGSNTGGRAVTAGTKGRKAIAHMANVLGWTFGLVPALLLTLQLLPTRVRQVIAMTAARNVLRPRVGTARDDVDAHERARLLAMRAAFDLPFSTLLRYTRDPLGDLARGDHDQLVRAVLEDAGLRATPSTGPAASVAPA